MNILKNVKLRLPANTARIEAVYLQLLELEWAHIYHDSIRGRPHMEQLALNIGR